MVTIILVFLLAISLSMDAFFMSVAYGTLNLNRKTIVLLSLIVGLYHFLMPLLGMALGNLIKPPQCIVSILFIVIGINMILDMFKESNVKTITLLTSLLFGFSVSLDSFTIGIGLSNMMDFNILYPITFCIFSGTLTFIGLVLGKKINEFIGSIAILIGGLTIITLGVYYIV